MLARPTVASASTQLRHFKQMIAGPSVACRHAFHLYAAGFSMQILQLVAHSIWSAAFLTSAQDDAASRAASRIALSRDREAAMTSKQIISEVSVQSCGWKYTG